jgi:hypothetical protein
MAMPFEAIADKYQVEFRSGLQNSTKSVNADLVFQKCKAEIPEYFQFRHAIEKCLDFQTWQDERGKKLEGQDLRTKIYEEVVWPLEYELSKAFSDICIENLDKFAQTLNMRRRGETIQRISPDSHPDMPQHSSNEWDERSTESADTRDYHQFSKFHQHSHKRFQRHLEDRIQDRIQHHMQDRRDHLQRKIAGGAMFAHHPERFVPSFNDNKSFKFFDDEMSFESHSLEQ